MTDRVGENTLPDDWHWSEDNKAIYLEYKDKIFKVSITQMKLDEKE